MEVEARNDHRALARKRMSQQEVNIQTGLEGGK